MSRAPATLTGEVPGDVNDSLTRAGRLPDPLTGLNFRRFAWVAERSWWFRKRFHVPDSCPVDAACVELSMDGLDVHADIWLNGTWIGHHPSAFYPFQADVGALLAREGENILLVRLTTGRERAPDPATFPLMENVPTEAGRGYPERGFKGRIYLRKPAYVWGWDWNPPLPTCGITRVPELRFHGRTGIDSVDLRTVLEGGNARITATVWVRHRTRVESAWADVAVSLTDADGREHVARMDSVFIASGETPVTLTVQVPYARLWWPNGAGEQNLYTVRATATVDGKTVALEPFSYGLKTVVLDIAPGVFQFRINGVPMFIKGGNWVPPDALYGRIRPERTIRLVEEAAAAHFNILRIWGGGQFETEPFYDTCDRLGILVWQDFMSACAPLPAHEPWFTATFRREAEFQVRRLRNRACLLLWCGNNEVAQSYAWSPRKDPDPGWSLYHELLPRLVHEHCPHIPYWPTSPYGGAESVHAPDVGDDHHWVVMRPEQEFWSSPEYWDDPARPVFNSEYGYGGPCCLESTREYLGYEPDSLDSEIARQHTNTFYDIPRVRFGIARHYRDPDGLPLTAYITLGGLCQGMNLGYSLESLRANRRGMGGIFWMYDDAWGENGWSIVDYYLRRKIAFYGVRRALNPQRLTLRRGGEAFGGEPDNVVVIGINESPDPLPIRFRIGYITHDGAQTDMQAVTATLAPRSRAIVAGYPVPSADRLRRGVVAAWPEPEEPVEPVVWRHAAFRDLNLPPARIQVRSTRTAGRDLIVTVASDHLAHGVHLDVDGGIRLSDHYFDLLPGESRTVRLFDAAALAGASIAATCVNSLAGGDIP